MAIAIYEDLAGRRYWADSTSSSTIRNLARGDWLLYDDTPSTPPPATDPLGAEMAERVPGTGPFAAALRAASVAAVEGADAVAPTGAWDFAQTPTIAGEPIGTGAGGGLTIDQIVAAPKMEAAFALPSRPILVADTSASPAPTALAFKRWFTKRHLLDLKIPLAELDLSQSPLLAGGSLWTHEPYENSGMTIAYSGGNLTMSHTDATMTQSALHLWPLEPFSVVELNVASWTAGTYGNMGFEWKSADSTERIVVTYSKSNARTQVEYIGPNATVGARADFTVATFSGAFTLRAQMQGRSVALWFTQGGTTSYAGRLDLGTIDFRDPAVRAGWTVGPLSRGHTSFTVAMSGFSMYLAGNGHADPRMVTYEDGSPIQAGETVWVTMTTRGVNIPDAYQGVYAYNTATGTLTATGAIFCDRGDGVTRNESAGHLFYDRTVGQWRYVGIGHSDYPGTRKNWLATTDVDLRFGINTVVVQEMDLPGTGVLYEDMHTVRNGSSWLATASKNASTSVLLTATDLLGPWTETVTAAVTSETGNVIVTSGGTRYVLAGTATPAYIVRSFTDLADLGPLTVDLDTGGNRVWPCVFPVKTPAGVRWHMLSFDRTSPAGSYSYGRVARYRA